MEKNFKVDKKFESEFDNFENVEDKVRSSFFGLTNKKIIETEIPNISRTKMEFYFHYSFNNNQFPFYVAITNKETRTIFIRKRGIAVIDDPSTYFLQCLDRAYERFTFLTESEKEKRNGYSFSNSHMDQDNFFGKIVEEFCYRRRFSCEFLKGESTNVYDWIIIDRNKLKYYLTISNIPSSQMIFFEKLAPSAVLGEYETDKNDLLIHLAQDLINEFETFKKLFKNDLLKEVYGLLNVEKWFRVEEQSQTWKENYVAIEKVRKQFENMIARLKHNPFPVNPELFEDGLETSQLREKLKRWFKRLLELHFGLRARQLRSREKYKLFYEHRITNAIVEHITGEPGVNEAFAHFQSLLRQCGAL